MAKCPCECDGKSTSLIKLPNTRVSVAAGNGSIKVLNGVGSCISPQDGNLRNAIQKHNQHAYRWAGVTNLVPRAFPSKNEWGKPWGRGCRVTLKTQILRHTSFIYIFSVIEK